MVAQGACSWDFVKKFPAHFKMEGWECGGDCCGGTRYTLTGPKGSIVGDYGFGEGEVSKEYDFYLHTKTSPPGTPFYPQRRA